MRGLPIKNLNRKIKNLESFETVYRMFLVFRCDGTCNDCAECVHVFVWACPTCGGREMTGGAMMQSIKQFRNGECSSCFQRAANENELGAEQIARQDAVDNAIFNLANELVPEKFRQRVGNKFGDGVFDWDIGWISEVREEIGGVLRKLLEIEASEEDAFEMEFYPYLAPEE